MSDLRELYQEVILDHYKTPRNCHVLDCANHQADGYNPLCGDQVTVYLKVEDGVIVDLSFKGKTLKEVGHLFDDFHQMVTTPPDSQDTPRPELGKLEVLAGVSEFPARVKCATLAWHTLQSALKNQTTPVSTEQAETRNG